jgi:hypothetical protein
LGRFYTNFLTNISIYPAAPSPFSVLKKAIFHVRRLRFAACGKKTLVSGGFVVYIWFFGVS